MRGIVRLRQLYHTFEFPGGFDFNGGIEGHFKVAVIVLLEHPLEGLFEERGVEGVPQHHVAPGKSQTINKRSYAMQRLGSYKEADSTLKHN